MSEAIYYMLENQYVITWKCPCFYRCTRGSDIGLLHSGHVASVYFSIVVEFPVLGNSTTPPTCGTLVYTRFHDDILYVAETVQAGKTLFRLLQK